MFKYLFPTVVLQEQLTGQVLNNVQNELDVVFKNLKFNLNDEDQTGGLLISDEGIQHTNDFVSRYNLKNLYNEVLNCVNLYLGETNTSPKVTIKNFMSWMTSLPPNAESTKHRHDSNGFIVVVYYYKVPDNSGNLRLYNSSGYTQFIKDEYVDIIPKEGTILVFPGWLYHEVLKNNSNEFRHSISISLTVLSELDKEV